MTLARVREKPPPPLDRGWSWMIVVGVFICAFFMVGIAKSYGLFLLAFKNHFGVSTAYAAMPIGLTAFVYALGAPTAIMVGELITPQRVVITGAVITLVGVCLCSLLVSMGYVIVMYGICVGIGNSCFYGNGLVMIGKYFRVCRSLATGLALAGASIGQFAMPPIIEYFLETYGLGGTLLLIGALYGHCAISGALFRPIEQYGPADTPVKVEKGAGEAEAVTEDKKALMTSSPEHTQLPEDTATSDTILDTSSPENGQTAHAGSASPGLGLDIDTFNNGKVTYKERRSVVSFVGVKSEGSQEFGMNDGRTMCENQIGIEGCSQPPDDDDDRNFLERKALLASTGSVFLVSPSVHDVSTIDSRAHGLDVVEEKKWTQYLKRVVDFSVLKNYITIFFTIVSFLCFFGYFNHVLFLPAINADKGIEKYDSALLISVCGVGDLIARIGTGFLADLNFIPRYQLKAAACVLSGINIFIFIYANTFSWLAFHCFCYGFLGGAYVCLMSVVLVDFVGLQLMAKNLAVVFLIQGIGAAVGQIFLGWVKDQTGSFSGVIIILSLNLVFGGLLLFCYPVVRRWEEARLSRIVVTDKSHPS